MIVRCMCMTAVLVALLSAPFQVAAETKDGTLADPNRTTLQRATPSVQPTASSGETGPELEARIQKLEHRIHALESAVPALAAGQSSITVKDDEIIIRAKRIRVIADGDLGMEAGKSVEIKAQQDFELDAGAKARLRAGARLGVESAAQMDLKAPLIKHNNGAKPVLRADVPPNPSPTVVVP